MFDASVFFYWFYHLCVFSYVDAPTVSPCHNVIFRGRQGISRESFHLPHYCGCHLLPDGKADLRQVEEPDVAICLALPCQYRLSLCISKKASPTEGSLLELRNSELRLKKPGQHKTCDPTNCPKSTCSNTCILRHASNKDAITDVLKTLHVDWVWFPSNWPNTNMQSRSKANNLICVLDSENIKLLDHGS